MYDKKECSGTPASESKNVVLAYKCTIPGTGNVLPGTGDRGLDRRQPQVKLGAKCKQTCS